MRSKIGFMDGELFDRAYRRCLAEWLRAGLDQRSYSTLSPVSTGMGDRLRAGKPHRSVTSHSSQLSLLPSAGRKMSTVQSAVTLCGWGVKAGMVHSTCE